MEGRIRGLEVAFVHSANGGRLADWYEEVLGIPRRSGDDHWIEFEVAGGSRFAVDVTGFPRSEVEAPPLMVCFTVDDIEAAVAARASGGEVGQLVRVADDVDAHDLAIGDVDRPDAVDRAVVTT